MEININPDDIDKYVKEAILNSSIGKIFKENIESELKSLLTGYNSPIKSICGKFLEKVVYEHLEKADMQKEINDAILKYVSPEVIREIIKDGIDRFMDRIEMDKGI